MSESSIDKLINDHKVLVLAGSGGVGKTTLSAAIAARAAALGKRALVLTIDPAKRLANALGLQNLPSEPILVPGQNYKGQLWAAVIDSKKVFDDFVVSHVPNAADRTKVLNNRLYLQLSTTLSGSQEYTALEKLFQLNSKGEYDLIVLDTPPAQHAVEFLRAPQKMYALFQNSIVKWFLPSEERRLGLRGIFDKSTKAVFSALENLTGAPFIEELREFFFVIRSLQETIQSHSAEIHRLLTGSSATFVIVTSFDEIKIKECRQFQKLLMTTGYTLSGMIINRSFPEWITPLKDVVDLDSKEVELLKSYYLGLRKHFERHKNAFESFAAEVAGDFEVIMLPDFDQDVHDLESVNMIAKELVNRSESK